jgi:fibronectin type 3 domain-containing protein
MKKAFLLLFALSLGVGPLWAQTVHGSTLTWKASTDTVAGYNIRRATTPGGETGSPINSTPITGLTYEDSNVVAGTTYYYVVTAVSSAGVESAPSNEAKDTIPFAPPSTLTVVGH